MLMAIFAEFLAKTIRNASALTSAANLKLAANTAFLPGTFHVNQFQIDFYSIN